MNYEALRTFFMWTTVFHFSILILWVFLFKFAQDWFRNQQGWFFAIPKEQFASLHYLMYGIYKLMAIVFSAVPYFVLVLMGAI